MAKASAKRVLVKPSSREFPETPDDVIWALQALTAGKASARQQIVALEWIVWKAAATYDVLFISGVDGQRETDFSLGRAFVGQAIKAATGMPTKPIGSAAREST